jgi:hypothetical protein
MRRRTAEERYKFNVRKQHRTLENFAAHEVEWAGDLMRWYGFKNIDMPDDEYRACAFFTNREYAVKPGSLSLLYQTYNSCMDEMPKVTKENAFDLLCYRFRLYAAVLKAGGFY